MIDAFVKGVVVTSSVLVSSGLTLLSFMQASAAHSKVAVVAFSCLGIAFTGALVAVLLNIQEPGVEAYLNGVRNHPTYFMFGLIPAFIDYVLQSLLNCFQRFVPDRLVMSQKFYVVTRAR